MTVFEYDDYKIYFQAQLLERRKVEKAASTLFSQALNVHPSLISQVLKGDKHFTQEQLMEACHFFGCSKLESRYIMTLLQEARAGTPSLRKYFQEQKNELQERALNLSNRIQHERVLTDTEMAQFYSSWIYSTVHLMSTLDRPISLIEAQTKLGLTPNKFKKILDFLVSIQMVRIENNALRAGTQSTHVGTDSPFLVKHHLNWRLKSAQVAEDITEEELMYTANFSISKKDFMRLREEILKLIQKFLNVVKDSPAEEIAQFNIDYFWIRK